MSSSAPAPAIAALLQQGYAAHRAGDWDTAERCYRQVLQQLPAEPDALQLLGLVAKRRGDLVLAEDCWRRSLAVRPLQPNVLNNLANLLDASGRTAEAESCLQSAIALQPGYADAHYNLARIRHARGDRAGAEAALAAALAASAQPSAGMTLLRARLLSEQGRLEEALAVLDQALAAGGATAALHHNRAVLLQRLGRAAAALEGHLAAQRLGADDADVHYNLGNTLQTLGRHEEALQAYRRALQRQPGHALALYDIARLRLRLDDPEPFAELEAEHRRPGSGATAAGIVAHLLWRAERFEEAAGWFRAALEREPRVARYLGGLGRCLVRLGEIDEGLAGQRQALALAPDDAELWIDLAASLLVAGRPEEAGAAADEALRLAPRDQHAWALRGLAWRALGDPRESWLNDEDAFVGIHDLEPPSGWPSMPVFLAALGAELDPLHFDHRAPVDQTLRRGTQTVGTLFDQGHPLVDVLKQRIAEAVDRHIALLPADTNHPFLSRRAARWSFTDSWSSRLGTEGFHVDHVHPHGWLSGVVYLRVPARCADTAAREGWLRFGRPHLELSRLGLGELARCHVPPAPGRLVLFPSMMWHGTTPFSGNEDRLTIAFDLVPDEGRAGR